MFPRLYLRSAWRTLQQPQSHGRCTPPFSVALRQKALFSSFSHFKQKQPNKDDESPEEWSSEQKQRKRGGRSPAAPTSLRRVAVEAQRSRDSILSKAQLREQGLYQTKVSTIECCHNLITDLCSLKQDSDSICRRREV